MLRQALVVAMLLAAACGPAPEPSESVSPVSGDTILYHCGGALFTIQGLLAPGNAEAGGSPPADALRAFLEGADPRWASEARFVPKTGWRAAGATQGEVAFIAESGTGTGWITVAVRLEAGRWRVGWFGDCGPRALVPDGVGARWWIDPDRPPNAADRSIAALVREQTCAGGRAPVGRIEPPLIRYDPVTITIVLATRAPGGAADCRAAPDAQFRIELAEPIGARAVLDGYELPARDAREEPEVGFGIGG